MEIVAPDICEFVKPGQFVNLYTDQADLLLPRPISVADVSGEKLRLIYAAVGAGTTYFSKLTSGAEVSVFGPLGTGYDFNVAEKNILLIGGGLGIPPLIYAARELSVAGGKTTTAVLGYAAEQFCAADFSAYCSNVFTISDNPAQGNIANLAVLTSGNVVDLLFQLESQNFALEDTYVYACGPKPMLKALNSWCKQHNISAQFSLEERMGCGYGACVGCSIDTLNGSQKICVDGPVFMASELEW